MTRGWNTMGTSNETAHTAHLTVALQELREILRAVGPFTVEEFLDQSYQPSVESCRVVIQLIGCNML